MFRLLFVSCVLAFCFAAPTSLVWSDCSSTSSQVINVTSVSTSPHVLKIPGSLHLSFEADVSKVIDVALLKFDFTRHTFGGLSVHIPCVNQFGSCSFDACSMLQNLQSSSDSGRNVSSQISSMFHNAGASISCPIPAQHVSVSDFVFSVPTLTPAASLISNGDYTIKIQLIQPATDAELGCLQFDASIQSAKPTDGPHFLFG